MFNIKLCVGYFGGNVNNSKAKKFGAIFSLIVIVSLTFVLYALAYSVKTEVLYTETFTIDSQEQAFCAFYLSSPAVAFEVTLTVSEGTIKWTPYSQVLFEATFGGSSLDNADAVYGWECETDDGTVKWRIDEECLDQIWYLCFLNEDSFDKTVTVEVTKLWSDQNYHDWI